MSKRPAVITTWMTAPDADALLNVEPIANKRNYGFGDGERPPAGWMNNILHTTGQDLEYLFGVLTANWEKTAWGLDRLDYGAAISGDCDDTTPIPGGQPLFRIVVGGTDDGGTVAQLRVSADGASWLERLPTHGGGTPIAGLTVVFWTGGHWLLGESTAGVGKVWRTADGATTGSAILDDANDWSATTLPGSTAGLVAFAAQDTTHLAAVATNKPIISTDDGSTWSNASLSGAATGNFTDVCWTGAAWLAITDDGEIYRAAAGLAGTWTKLATDLPDKPWRLEPGPDGFVLAYPYTVAATDDWYVSTDHGATWALQVAPSAVDFVSLRRIRYLDGNWLALTNAAAPVWQATGTDAGLWVRVTLDNTTSGGGLIGNDARDVRRVEGRYVLLGNERAHRTPHEQGLDPGAFVPTANNAALRDAAYLRGNVVSGTSPADRDVLEWDNSTKEWTPTGPGAWTRTHATATSYGVAADVAVVLADSSGGAINVTLPAPAAGRCVEVLDAGGAAATHAITIKRNAGEKIDRIAADYAITTNKGAVALVSDGTDWFVRSARP